MSRERTDAELLFSLYAPPPPPEGQRWQLIVPSPDGRILGVNRAPHTWQGVAARRSLWRETVHHELQERRRRGQPIPRQAEIVLLLALYFPGASRADPHNYLAGPDLKALIDALCDTRSVLGRDPSTKKPRYTVAADGIVPDDSPRHMKVLGPDLYLPRAGGFRAGTAVVVATIAPRQKRKDLHPCSSSCLRLPHPRVIAPV